MARRRGRGGSNIKKWSARFGRFARFLRRLPRPAGIGLAVLVLATLWLVINWTYQVVRKPTELFFFVSGTLSKTPAETWRTYGSLFRAHSTPTLTPEFLAALAQVEGAGNPVARTYWRWRPSWNPLEWYQPASSSVGMYQITNGTFLEARRYCIHDHAVAEAGVGGVHGCWFNGLYTRVIPSHAIEMTAALLDHQVAMLLRDRQITRALPDQKRNMAAVIHLCGPGGGSAYLQGGIRAAAARCGEDVVRYVAAVNAATRQFLVLSAQR